MRDRLIELLDNATVEKAKCYPNGTPAIMYCEKAVSRQVVYQLADYLLKNGVIVPPCKVGDKVYEIGLGKLSGQKTIKQSKVTAIKITDKLTITLDYTTNFYDTDIGRWLFVGDNAKEKAEQALKGGTE